ncbi:MAG: receptor with intracellular metal dependent phosphohydrolase [Chloroflexi bacterium]|nr:receptor with intracellular metal dependent phosphohydrolase [Chloroflexota bacterium]
MLANRSADAVRLTRRQAGRLAVAALALIVAMTAMLGVDYAPQRATLQVGDLVPADIAAPRAITYENLILTAETRRAAADAVPPQYDFTSERAITIAAAEVEAFEADVRLLDTAYDPAATEIQRTLILERVAADLSPTVGETVRALESGRWAPIREEAIRVLDTIERTELRDTEVAVARKRLSEQMAGGLSEAERMMAAELIAPFVVANSSFSPEKTQLERDRQSRAIPTVAEQILKGEIIVRGGTKLTQDDAARLAAFGLADTAFDVAGLAGWLVLSALLVTMLLGWIWRFRRGFWHRNNVLGLISILLLFATFALNLTAGRAALPFLLPLAAIPILLAVLLDAEVAIVVAAILAVVAGTVNGPSLEIATYVFLGGLAGVLAIRRGDRLQAFLQAGAVAFVVQALVVSSFSLLEGRDITGIIQLTGAAALSAGGAAVAAVGSFAVLGNVFGILTVFQLLELANPSQLLLRRLLIETPGTYHHSLMVGNLAERAAEAIGADALLTRVAAYYHDVGKLQNPVGFIENQAGGENVHDELEPEVSAQILKQHVADGIDIAYEGRLPKALIAFIPQHHGTAMISYFYAKAREEAAAPFGGLGTDEGRRAAEAVDPRRFRHIGPKPQSREAALIMLADGVEASVRSLSSRDEGAIRAMVARIIAERMDDGQFDECDLTLRDLDTIEQAFVAQLLGMYHQRVAYPQSKVVELEARRAAAASGGGGGDGGRRPDPSDPSDPSSRGR